MEEDLLEAYKRRSLSAQHAVQSGVAAEMQIPARQSATEPKHLRMGVNSALVQDSALVALLVEKGVITWLEYWKGQAEAWEAEKARYEAGLEQHYGRKVTLA